MKFLPNESEALAISGKEAVLAAGTFLGLLCPLVVIKCGADGALVFTRGKVKEYKILPNLLAG